MIQESGRRRLRGACTGALVAGILMAVVGLSPSTAGAAQPPDNADQTCLSALQGGADPQLVLSTDVPADAEVHAGDEIVATLTWGADVWNSLSKVVLCMTVDGVLDEGSIFVEAPGVDDGTASTTFTVPELAKEVCVHGRASGAPSQGNLTDDTHKTGQLCFPVSEPSFECPPDTEWVDADRDGAMSAEECEIPFECPPDTEWVDADEDGEMTAEECEIPFECPPDTEWVDADRDGEMTAEECREVQSGGEIPFACPPGTDWVDADGDGEMSAEECREVQSGGETPPFQCPADTDWTDTDGDGLMAEDECSKVLAGSETPEDTPTEEPSVSPQVRGTQTLPATGVESVQLLELAIGLLLVGGLAVQQSRRRLRA